jgi:hypothetical protein
MARLLRFASRKFETAAFQSTTYTTHIARHGDTTTQRLTTFSGHLPQACVASVTVVFQLQYCNVTSLVV